MTNIKTLFNKIIPPSDHQHRNGFSNNHLIDNLTGEEKIKIEEELIYSLTTSNDILIGETLAYLKSFKALPLLREKLELVKNPASKILWASCIYKICPEEIIMKDIALDEFIKINETYILIGLFYTLATFKDIRINNRIEMYVNHKIYLLAYNARIALGQGTKELIKNKD